MSARLRGLSPLCLVLALSACTTTEVPAGLTEPIVVQAATFKPGLVIEAPVTTTPLVTAVDQVSGIAQPGQVGKALAGRTSEDAWAVAFAVEGIGSGYWVAPVLDENPAFPGERDFTVMFDFGRGIPPGELTLNVFAIDEQGRAGPVYPVKFCVAADAPPDNLNGCEPTLKPAAAVLTLAWDVDSDLDLVVRTQDDKRVASRTPTTVVKTIDEPKIPAEQLADPTIGRLTRDSNNNCVIDGRNNESLVWGELPERRKVQVFADLFASCGQGLTRFVATQYARVETGTNDKGKPTYALRQVTQVSGLVPALSASGGKQPEGGIGGLFLGTFDLDAQPPATPPTQTADQTANP
jgi:hypothetical protein